MNESAKMHRIAQYLQKQGKRSTLFAQEPDSNLQLIVVIPAYKEELIGETIQALYNCERPSFSVEILVYVNGSVDDSDITLAINQNCCDQLALLKEQLSDQKMQLHYHVNLKLAEKEKGVGRARKLLMDEATVRFHSIGMPTGIIVNLDADTTVQANYFQEIERYFEKSQNPRACSIHFEHRYINPESEEAIIKYESHLRYFIGMQKLLKLPFAFQTVGSAMAVNTYLYCAVGGMNTRQAGEDFYFMHKFTKINKCGELNSTTVQPSDRVSDRVPFGTGKAVGDAQLGKPITTYSFRSFEVLQEMTQNLRLIYDGKFEAEYPRLNPDLLNFLESIDFEKKVREIKVNTRNLDSFTKRFYQYFDAFQLMKYLHYMRDHGQPNIEIDEAIKYFLAKNNLGFSVDAKTNLETLRIFDKTYNLS